MREGKRNPFKSRKRFLVSVFAEPFSDGFVVEFQAEIGEENAADDND